MNFKFGSNFFIIDQGSHINKGIHLDIIFDLDGTLINLDHRVHFVKQQKPDWKSFEKAIKDDTIIPEMRSLLVSIASDKNNRLIFCTGRKETTREDTLEQINKITHGIKNTKSATNFPLYMRSMNDFRPDPEVKSDLYDQKIIDGFNPIIVFDDRASVVNMWRSRGLRCLQCALGNF